MILYSGCNPLQAKFGNFLSFGNTASSYHLRYRYINRDLDFSNLFINSVIIEPRLTITIINHYFFTVFFL